MKLVVALGLALMTMTGVARAADDGLPAALPPDPAVWQGMLSKLGVASLPAGGRAYAVNSLNTCSDRSFIRVVVLPDGATYAQASWAVHQPPTPLQAHEADAFEAAVSASNFESWPTGAADLNTILGVDCFGVSDLAANVDGRFHQAVLSGDHLGSAANALWQIVGARTGQPWATPAPWWSDARDRIAIPFPDALAAELCTGPTGCRDTTSTEALAMLGLKPLEPAGDVKTYRLIVVRAGHKPAAVELDDNWTPRGRQACWMFCVGERWVRIKASGWWWEHHEPADFLDRDLGVQLTLAGYATAPLSLAGDGRCGTIWFLEALVGGRYRFVAGNACTQTSLSPVVTRIAKLGGVRL